MEVGIGGRYDSTNVFPEPIVCGITSLGLGEQQLPSPPTLLTRSPTLLTRSTTRLRGGGSVRSSTIVFIYHVEPLAIAYLDY